jgi:4-hydroxy-2-oxoheptanedioate aldolase
MGERGDGMDHNLRERFFSDETLYGLLVKMPSSAIVEMGAKTGFDLVVIDCEHGAGETSELEHHIRAADSCGIPTLIRVGSQSEIEVLRALDAGGSGIIVPHVISAKQATKMVESVYYPPIGKRGLATSTRAGCHTLISVEEHINKTMRNITVILQIEDKEALEVLDSIASVQNVDMLFIGVNDLSLSLGYPGQYNHPVVIKAVEKIVETTKEYDHLQLGVIAQNVEEAKVWRDRGAKLIIFPSTYLFAQKLFQVVETVKKEMNSQ